MLRLLSEQLRMFVAVMGVGYACPVALIVDRDREIFTAIDDGNGDLAVERWRVKLDEAQVYMFDRMAEAGHLLRQGGYPKDATGSPKTPSSGTTPRPGPRGNVM